MLARRWYVVAALLAGGLVFGQSGGMHCVTVEEAAKVIDLRKLETPPETVQPANKGSACLNFKTTGEPKATLAFFQKQLTALGWKETVPSFVGAKSASATFGKDGYHLSFFTGEDFDKKAGNRFNVNIINMGNLDTRQLPAPENSRAIISQQLNTHYLCETLSQDDGKKIMREKLIALGWEPYGKAADMQTFKKNAVKLDLMVMKSASQQNKTAVAYTSRIMSLDVPAPVEASLVQYHDMPAQLSVVTKGTIDDVAGFYTREMPKRGWKATTEGPVKAQLNSVHVFANAAGETLAITYQQVRENVHVKATLGVK